MVYCQNFIEFTDQNTLEPKYVLFLMELADMSFAKYLKASALSEKVTKDFFSQIFKGVQYIHRDLKSDNVLMFVNQSLPNGYLLKITDFGLAHIFGDQSSFLEKESRGTPFYMASEIRDMTLMSRQVLRYFIG